ncbi:MAG: PGF-pre-PGF domain-containing protein [DPANN group archaeon]|nr:PGF-pre-PGF domain-containing protein [DPANN group archaeon]
MTFETLSIGELGPSKTFDALLENSQSLFIDRILVTASQRGTLDTAQLEVTKLDALPRSIKSAAGKTNTWLLFQLQGNDLDAEDVEETQIYFIVEKSWLDDNKHDPKTVRLYRYDEENLTWVELPTEQAEETTRTITFSSVTPGFSYFAVTATNASQFAAKKDIESSTFNCRTDENCFTSKAKNCELVTANLPLTSNVLLPGVYKHTVTGKISTNCGVTVQLIQVNNIKDLAQVSKTMSCEIPLDVMPSITSRNVFQLARNSTYCQGELVPTAKEQEQITQITCLDGTKAASLAACPKPTNVTAPRNVTTNVTAPGAVRNFAIKENISGFRLTKYEEVANGTEFTAEPELTLTATVEYTSTQNEKYTLYFYKYSQGYLDSQLGTLESAMRRTQKSASGAQTVAVGSHNITTYPDPGSDFIRDVQEEVWPSGIHILQVKGENATLVRNITTTYLALYPSDIGKVIAPAQLTLTDSNEKTTGREYTINSDGIKSWVEQVSFAHVGINITPLKMDFINNAIGFIAGTYENKMVFIKTINSGNTFTKESELPDTVPIDIAFADANNGWMITQNNRIYKTSNGGKAWQPQTNVQGADGVLDISQIQLNDIDVYSANETWIAANQDRIFHTSNGGSTWNAVPRQISIILSADWNSVDAVAEREAWIAGALGVIHMKSENNSWVLKEINQTIQNIKKIDYMPVESGFTVAQNTFVPQILSGKVSSVIYALTDTEIGVSYDNAKSWTFRTHNVTNPGGMDFLNPLNGWIAGKFTMGADSMPISASSQSLISPTETNQSTPQYMPFDANSTTLDDLSKTKLYFTIGNTTITDIDMIDSNNGWAIDRGTNGRARLLRYQTPPALSRNVAGAVLISSLKQPTPQDVKLAAGLIYNHTATPQLLMVNISEYFTEQLAMQAFDERDKDYHVLTDRLIAGTAKIRFYNQKINDAWVYQSLWRSGKNILVLSNFTLNSSGGLGDAERQSQLVPLLNVYLPAYPSSLSEKTFGLSVLQCTHSDPYTIRLQTQNTLMNLEVASRLNQNLAAQIGPQAAQQYNVTEVAENTGTNQSNLTMIRAAASPEISITNVPVTFTDHTGYSFTASSCTPPSATSKELGLEPGLQGLWHFNGNRNDDSANNNQSTYTGSPEYAPGKIGYGISLNGENQWASLPTTITKNGTFMFWFKPKNNLPTNTPYYLVSRNDGRPYLRIEANGKIQLDVFNTVNSHNYFTSDATHPLSNDSWHHIAFTWGNGQANVFLNGTNIISKTYAGELDTIGDPFWKLGKINLDSQNNELAAGTFDEVAWFNRSLTQADVEQRMKKAL